MTYLCWLQGELWNYKYFQTRREWWFLFGEPIFVKTWMLKSNYTGCPWILGNLAILEMSWNFFCPGVSPGVYHFQSFVVEMLWTFFATVYHFFSHYSVRVPSTLKNLKNSLLSLILLDNLILDFLYL